MFAFPDGLNILAVGLLSPADRSAIMARPRGHRTFLSNTVFSSPEPSEILQDIRLLLRPAGSTLISTTLFVTFLS